MWGGGSFGIKFMYVTVNKHYIHLKEKKKFCIMRKKIHTFGLPKNNQKLLYLFSFQNEDFYSFDVPVRSTFIRVSQLF